MILLCSYWFLYKVLLYVNLSNDNKSMMLWCPMNDGPLIVTTTIDPPPHNMQEKKAAAAADLPVSEM